MAEDPSRWEGVYQNKQDVETSWFEDRPQVSLDLIAATGVTTDAEPRRVCRRLQLLSKVEHHEQDNEQISP